MNEHIEQILVLLKRAPQVLKTWINVAEDFTKYPGGRYRTDGPYSAQYFREKFLVPALKNFERVEIQLDGTMGYGSSFLEEAFGGLVRHEGFCVSRLHRALKLTSTNEVLIHSIFSYIREAVPELVCPVEMTCPHAAAIANALL